jgi:hypothetical protein
MAKIQTFFYISVFIIIVSGCSLEPAANEKETSFEAYNMPSSNGTHNELTLFCDDDLWNNCGVKIITSLAEPVKGLPQNEPRFNISRLPHNSISKITKRSKSILSLQLFPDSSSITIKYNLWAHPQLVIQMVAPTANLLTKLFNSHSKEIIKKYELHDQEILKNRISSNSKPLLPNSLKELGIKNMLIPRAYNTTISKSDFKILRADTKKSIQYLMAWSRPYIESDYKIESEIISEQNELMENNFEGFQEKSYLSLERKIPIDINYSNKKGVYIIEHRGLFRTELGFGGGPFVTFTYIDEKNNRRLSISSIVYAPSTKKRKMMLELEASLRSVELL